MAWAATAGADGEAGRPQGSLAIIKPRVLALLVFAGLTTAVMAGGRGTDPGTLLLLLVGGLLSVGAANVLNNVLDLERDSLMERTMWRPLPAGTVGPRAAVAAAAVMGSSGLALLWLTVNALTALLTLAGILFYVLVYTVLLKTRTPENIVLGGIAGAFPPLVGWTAITGTVGTPALLVGLLVVLWTPPHFWSLALLHKEDYRRAGVPMLPVVHGDEVARRRIVAYTVGMLCVSMLLVRGGGTGPLYLVGSLAMGALLLALSVALLMRRTEEAARRLFRASNVYLAVLFVVSILDALLPAWHLA